VRHVLRAAAAREQGRDLGVNLLVLKHNLAVQINPTAGVVAIA